MLTRAAALFLHSHNAWRHALPAQAMRTAKEQGSLIRFFTRPISAWLFCSIVIIIYFKEDSMKKLSMIIFAAVLGVSVHAYAIVMNFNDFSDTSLLTLNGNTQTVSTTDGIVLRLTPAERNQSGSAFSTETVNASNFSTYFQFRITEPGGTLFDCNEVVGADGIVFVIQSIASDIGGAGQGIGYAGIETSIGVEFDTWCNGANNDPNSNHIGVDLNGSVVHDPSESCTKEITPAFDDGNVWYAWVDYDGTTLEARINQTGVRPSEPDIQKEVDVPDLLGQDSAFIGFTSGTGLDWGNHDILYWEYRDTYDPIVVQPDCEDVYQDGYEAGRQACIEDPESCGIQTSGDYDQGYEEGYAAGLLQCNGTGECPMAAVSEKLDLYVPNAVYTTLLGDMNLWLKFEYLEDLTWELKDFDIVESEDGE